MNELALFSLALGLAKPWQVVDIQFSKEEGRLDLSLDFVKGAKFPCPSWEETKEGEVHDTQDRTWRHLNFFQYETYLHARVPLGLVRGLAVCERLAAELRLPDAGSSPRLRLFGTGGGGRRSGHSRDPLARRGQGRSG